MRSLPTPGAPKRAGWGYWAFLSRQPPGEKIRVSVCRYDAHRDTNTEPDVASTSNHAECDFHRPDDWPEYTVPAG